MSDLIHVTQVLRDAGLVDTTWFNDYMRDRGTALHRATQLHDEGDLNPDSVDPAIKESLAGYLKFLKEVEPVILAVEEKVEKPKIYQGRLDRRLKINGREGVLDIKGVDMTATRLQVAAYAMTFDRPMARWALLLRVKLGSYKLIEYRERRKDDLDFMAAVRIAAFRRRHGLTS